MAAEVYSYRWIYRLLYRYSNIIVTLLLLLYLLPAVILFSGRITDYLYISMLIMAIWLLNRYFFKLYRLIPYTIEIDGDSVRCSNFAFSRKKVEFLLSEVTKLEGGIFEGKPNGLMKIHVEGKKITVGFFVKISGAKALESVILSKVNSEIYNKVLENLGLDKSALKKKDPSTKSK